MVGAPAPPVNISGADFLPAWGASPGAAPLAARGPPRHRMTFEVTTIWMLSPVVCPAESVASKVTR